MSIAGGGRLEKGAAGAKKALRVNHSPSFDYLAKEIQIQNHFN
jgi:hypothetical protein